MELSLEGMRYVHVLLTSLAAALALLVVGFLIGRLGRSRASHVVFLPADRPIPVSSENYERAAEESEEATTRPKRFRWVFLGVTLGVFLQLGLLTLLGVAPKFCELRGWNPPAQERGAQPSSAGELSERR